MIIPILLFILGLILLVKGGDWFVDGAVSIAESFNLPKILIGATVVSIGTTVPEVMVSSASAISGHGEIAYGNAIGSIICNTALIAAITIAIRPSEVDKKSLKTPLIMFFIAAVAYMFEAYVNKGFSRVSGILFLCIFVYYMFIQAKDALREKDGLGDSRDSGGSDGSRDFSDFSDSSDFSAESYVNRKSLVKDVVLLIVGAILIAVGANLLVDNGTLIAAGLGVPESVIALTFVALGTSLPELVTAITSLVKGQSDLSLGNIIGANLFNIVFVCGTAITLNPFAIPSTKTIMGYNSSLVVDLPLMLLVMLLLSVPALIRGKLSRIQGIILLIVYALFCVYQFV